MGMTLGERIQVLIGLGEILKQYDERLQAHAHRASVDNPWFTPENIRFAIDRIAEWLTDAVPAGRQEAALKHWTRTVKDPGIMRRIGVIMAGNIPAVGFHDILCVFVSGNISVIKLSDKDKYLIPFMLKVLEEHDPRTQQYFEFVDKLQNIDAVIATGSNNSARYFEYYFSKYPYIIRRNRNAVAVLSGTESDEDLAGLCEDIFMYFGLGCRSVSHCFVPEGYDFTRLVDQLKRYGDLANHNKYRNNLDYNIALNMLNQTPLISLTNLLLVENPALISPVSCLHYSYYHDIGELTDRLQNQSQEIQCVVTKFKLGDLPCVGFGEAQKPAIDDYADGIDTLAFLQNLN